MVAFLEPDLDKRVVALSSLRDLLTVEERGEGYKRIYCSVRVGKLTDKIIIQMAKAIPEETMREWAREAKVYSSMR